MDKEFVSAPYLVGIFCGLLFGVLAYSIKRKISSKSCEFDERQMACRGIAFQAGFFTMLLAGMVVALTSWAGFLPGEALPWHVGALLLGVGVFAVVAIRRDAYVGFQERPRKFFFMGGVFVVALGGNALRLIGTENPMQRVMRALDGEVAVLWLVIMLALALHLHRGKKEEK